MKQERIKHSNNLKQLREKADSKQDEIVSSLKPCTGLLKDVFIRLELKGKVFKIFEAVTADELEEFWSVLLLIDHTITIDTTTKKVLKSKEDMCAFIKHCCRVRHYSFQFKKCGKALCSICKPVCLDPDTFSSLHYLPDPIPGNDGHFKSFE